MGKHNSSRTRVAPIFDRLMQADATGATWLDGLVALSSHTPGVNVSPTGLRLIDWHGRRWGSEERSLSAPLALLEHLVQGITPEQVVASGDAGEVRRRRMALAHRDADQIAVALAELRSGKRGRHWFVLEGESRPDAMLETSDVVFVVEGKRTERSCTSKTKWMGRRSQLIRHMDAVSEAYRAKRVLGLLVVEGDGGSKAIAPSAYWIEESAKQIDPGMLEASLPHRTPTERERIAAGVLAPITWQSICAANDISWPPFPDVA